jgi:hypothetical protein
VSPNVARNFAAAGGVTDMHSILQVELLGQFGETRALQTRTDFSSCPYQRASVSEL